MINYYSERVHISGLEISFRVFYRNGFRKRTYPVYQDEWRKLMRISEQSKQENRARILEKAAGIFTLKGFEDTTTRDIALASGVAAGTLFNYFPSKETLAMTMVTEALGQGREDFLKRCTGCEDLTE